MGKTENQLSDILNKHPELIVPTASWIRCGNINLSTGESENVQEIRFDSPLGISLRKC